YGRRCGGAPASAAVTERYFPSYARSSAAMSSFTIFSIAFMTRCDFLGSRSVNNSVMTVGTICHDSPNLSLSQPHCTSCPPAESFSQNVSTSFCVLQFTTNETASVNLNC